ncbi:MAG: hypothetical protein ACH349_07620 [Candidatus Rhabdochlamydia sp.]
MTHTNGQAKYKDLCFTFDDLQAAFCSGYTKGYNDSDSNEERTVSPIEGQLSVSEIVKRRKNLPATAPANGEEWEEKIGIKYFTTWGTLRRFAKAEDLLKDIRTLLKNRGDEICAECVLVVERAKELERERAVGIIKRVQKEVEEYPFKGFVGKIKRTEKLLQEALASIAEGGGKA